MKVDFVYRSTLWEALLRNGLSDMYGSAFEGFYRDTPNQDRLHDQLSLPVSFQLRRKMFHRMLYVKF